MTRSRNNITIHDVAKEAGVSVSTVSRVLNDKDDVAEATYSRVQTVIAELGYTSSLAAKGMRSRKMNVLGLIMPDVEEPFALEVLKGVNEAIVEHDYDLILYTNGNIRNERSAQKEQQYVSLLNNSITDGVIIVTPRATLFSTNSPVVAVDPNTDTIDYPFVTATNREGALAMMAYLTGLGHRRIGFVGGRADLQSANRREQGYLDGLAAAGIPVDPALICEGDFTFESGFQCGRSLLALDERPTAIFAANDQSAFGVVEAAHALGLTVPDDLSVAGFDNVPESKYQLPYGLTTVEQHVRQMGYEATTILITLVQGKEIDEQIKKIPTELMVRSSCRAL